MCHLSFFIYSYGTGCFLLKNVGTKVFNILKASKIIYIFLFNLHWIFFYVLKPVMSDHGLLTTVAYKLGRDKPACYALEVILLNVDIVYYIIMFLADYFLPKQFTYFVYGSYFIPLSKT